MHTSHYYDRVSEVLQYLIETQMDATEDGAKRISQSLTDSGIFHVFGSGHSHLIARDIVGRAGGLVPLNTITDPTEGVAERCEGYAKQLLDAYAKRVELRPTEGILIISNSGINAAPVEMAMEAHDRGLFTIGLTSIKHSQAMPPRHSSGKKLYELVDVVLDNGVPYGDASVKLLGVEQKVGPLSTIAGSFILHMMMIRVAELMTEMGHTPPILLSLNTKGGTEANDKLLARYQGRLDW